MTRDEFFEAFDSIINLLEEEKIITKLKTISESLRENPSKRDNSVTNIVLRTYSLLNNYEKKSSVLESHVIDKFHINFLFDEEFWTSLLNGQDQREYGVSVLGAIRHLHFLEAYGLPLVEPLRRKFDNVSDVEEDSATETFIIPDQQRILSIEELKEALDTIALTYSVVSQIFNKTEYETKVIYIESGSKIRLKIQGSGKATQAITDLIGGIFNRNVFRANFKHSANTENLLESLNAYKEINSSQQEGSITIEEASRLKELLNRQVAKLSELNIVTEDIFSDRKIDYKLIESQNLKRLSAPQKKLPSPKKKKNKKKKNKGAKKTSRTTELNAPENETKSKTRKRVTRRAPVRKPKSD